MAARILAMRFSLCPCPAKKNSFGGTLQELFQTYHPPLDADNYVQTAHNSSFGEISLDLSVHQLDVFGINTVEFRCQAKDFNRFRFLKKLQNPYLPYFEEHN